MSFSHSVTVLRAAARRAGRYVLQILRWILFGGICGFLCGAAGAAFWYALHFAADARAAHPWLLYLLPAAGLLIVFLYRAAGQAGNKDANEIIKAVQERRSIPARVAPLIFVSTFLTHLTGGSAGKESSAVQLGGTIGSVMGQVLRLGHAESRVLILCGMAGVFAGVFGTPITAIVFMVEFVCVGVIYHAALFPGLICCFVAAKFAAFLGVPPVAFALTALPDPGPLTYLRVAALAVAAALVGVLFCYLSEWTAKLFARIRNAYIRIALSGAILVGLTLLVGSQDYNGTGMELMERIFAGGSAVAWAWALKLVFTVLTMNTGFKGGEIVPSFCIGAALGYTLAPLAGLPPVYGAAVGLVSLFCSVTNAPLSSIFLSAELFGHSQLGHFTLACILAFVCSGSVSLYESQRFAFDKLRARMTNFPKE